MATQNIQGGGQGAAAEVGLAAAATRRKPKLKVCAMPNDERSVHASNMKGSFAAHSNQVEVLRNVLAQGNCDINGGRPKDGATMLYFASQAGHEEIVEMLVQSRANIDLSTTDDGTTPLYVACEQNKTNVVKRLIIHGADPNKAKTSDGATPLHTACFQNNALHVCLLIMAGARKKQKALNGMIPQDVAHTKEHYVLGPLLRLPVRWRPSVHSQFPEHFRMKVCALLMSPRIAEVAPGVAWTIFDGPPAQKLQEVKLRLDLSLLLELLGCIEWEETALKALEAERKFRIATEPDFSKMDQSEQDKVLQHTEPEKLWEINTPQSGEVLKRVHIDTALHLLCSNKDEIKMYEETRNERRVVIERALKQKKEQKALKRPAPGSGSKPGASKRPRLMQHMKKLYLMKQEDLCKLCEYHGLLATGTKSELIERLHNKLMPECIKTEMVLEPLKLGNK